VSRRYGDVYHSRSGALGQARNVFLAGNGLPQRWRGRRSFTVCETGFGLGNNFLALWDAWRGDADRPARLHVVSFEAHPFRKPDLRGLLLAQHEGEMAALARQLADAWPLLLPGIHRLEFEAGAVTLTLVFGPVARTARQVRARVDAFFLDGFSPRVNPDMWSPALFGQMARLAAPQATAATWCCAGQVRRDLRDAGFLVSKAAGFGGKREMTTATLRPELSQRQAGRAGAPMRGVLVVGGGLAGAGVAHALAMRGHGVTVFDPVFAHGLGASHAGHEAIALSPVASSDDDLRARLARAGTLRALQRWQSLPEEARPLVCGSLVMAQSADEEDAQRRTVDILGFPGEWVSWLDRRKASERAGIPLPRGALYFPLGQRVQPAALLEGLLGQPGIACRAESVAALRRLEDGRWQALDDQGEVLAEAGQVVLANARHAGRLLACVTQAEGGGMLPVLPRLQAMYGMAGQVSHYRAGDIPTPRCIVSADGYTLPMARGRQVAGSTYVLYPERAALTAEGEREIGEKLERLLGDADAPGRLAAVAPVGGWAGWRAAVHDRLPVIGQAGRDTGLWLACAYGSRGLTWSALAGDIIGAQMDEEPVPLERDLLGKIAPR
jgi:tRNA 5-methylaminomethyl-2-thiouridine biosynthesis bifunctional protein